MRNNLERQIARARSENPYGENHNEHGCSDECENSRDPEVAQEEADHQAGKNSAQAAPGIDKAHGSRANSPSLSRMACSITKPLATPGKAMAVGG